MRFAITYPKYLHLLSEVFSSTRQNKVQLFIQMLAEHDCHAQNSHLKVLFCNYAICSILCVLFSMCFVIPAAVD